MSNLKKANDFFKRKDYKRALEEYNKVIKAYPELESSINFNLQYTRKKLNSNLDLNSLVDSKPKLKNDLKSTEHKSILQSNKTERLIKNNYDGRLEKFDNGHLRGWAVNQKEPSEIFDLSIYINGILFCKIKNNGSRKDLLRHGKSSGKGGYSLELPPEVLNQKKVNIEIRFPDNELLGLKVIEGSIQCNSDDKPFIPIEEKVSIIVPIYNAPEDLKVCIERLIEYTQPEVDIILINDASPDKSINQILENVKNIENIRIFHNKKNLGFTKTVNKGIELSGQNDVLFLNSDARVTPRWLEGIRNVLSTDAKIATVTPMSDRAGAFSAPNIGNENDLPKGIQEVDYAVEFRRRSIGYYPTVPTGNGFCMYVRRSCINEIGALDEKAFPKGYGEENDFCMRARSKGWRNVIDDRTYVFHDRNKSFGEQKTDLIKAGRSIVDQRYPDYKKATAVFSNSSLINSARFKAKEALENCKNKKIIPRSLFVISTLTGGTPQTNRDLMLALVDRVEPWLLHCDSKTISLYRVYKNKQDDLIKQHILKEEIEPLTHASAEYDRVVRKWLFEIDFEIIHIRHLAWHSLSLPKLAKESGARVAYSFHDFYSLCPTIKLLDGNNIYCDGVCTKSSGECKAELWDSNSFPTLKNSWVNQWRDKFQKALKYCDVYITTHSSARDTIINNLNISREKFHVIPHGRDFEQFEQLSEHYGNGEALKILIPGNISKPKGSEIILNLLKLDKKERLHFHILGRSNIKIQHPRLTFHGEYKREDFAEHVKKIKPHVGAVFSIWNETWCHTLTELWSVGIPTIVTDFETLKDRVEKSGAGWVVSHSNMNTLYNVLVNEIANEKAIEAKRQKVLMTQKNNLRTYQNSDMALKYLDLYLANKDKDN